MAPPRRPAASVRLFKLLLRLFPAEFRGDFGAEMEADFSDQLRDARRGGRRPTAALWRRTLPSMLRAGLVQHAAAVTYDARFALRSMARTPAFTAVALLIIALGTGANAAMFSVVDAIMLRSPFPDPDRLAIVRVQGANGRTTSAISSAQFRSLRDHTSIFDGVAALGGGQRPILTGLGEPRRMNVECVTADMFRVLGTPPLAGRTFSADEDRPGAASAVVVSYQFWRRDFAGAADAVGRVITLNNVPTTVVGIMPRRFGGPFSRNNNDGWVPLGPTLDGQRTAGCAAAAVNVFARLKPGATLESAARQATDSAAIARLEDWQGKTGGRLTLMSLDEQTASELRTPLLALLGAVGLVLLIACANVANLQMERLFGRRVEMAVRMALGATRARTVTQTLTENLVLFLLGAFAGIAAARWTQQLIVGLLPAYVPHANDIEVSGRVLAATLAVAVLTGLAVGLIPAVQGTSPALMNDLRASTRSSSGRGGWTRRGLVVGQVALSLTLLVGAMLMIATFRTLRPDRPGFTASDKLTANLRLQGRAASASSRVFDNVFAHVQAVPGVRSVSASTYLPMSGMVAIVSARAGSSTQDAYSGVVTPNYFAEMDIPIVQGRAFVDQDGPGAPQVAIVNEAFLRKMLFDRAALGARVDVTFFDGRTESRQIVGVLRDTRSAGGDLKARPEIYMPLAQSSVQGLNLIVRAPNPGDPRLAARIRSALYAADPTQVLDRVMPMSDMLDSTVSTSRFGAWLLGTFAAMALLLAAVGLAASIAWWVSQRTREIGVRMALGARPATVTRMFLRQGVALTLAGIALGLGGAAACTRLLESWLYGVTPLDPRVFTASAVGMLAIAVTASYLPARRAARVDPVIALRTE
ncbi:MAG TPA: ABC transporter permease [Vicinamibacterales bacterium]|nr:ABC transporter permease [Vicinamibacterales bacterium]